MRRRAAEEGHLDVLGEAADAYVPVLVLDPVERPFPSTAHENVLKGAARWSALRRRPRSLFQPGMAAI